MLEVVPAAQGTAIWPIGIVLGIELLTACTITTAITTTIPAAIPIFAPLDKPGLRTSVTWANDISVGCGSFFTFNRKLSSPIQTIDPVMV